jgi:hypothetical protein
LEFRSAITDLVHENGKPNQDVTFFTPYRFSPGV